VNTIYIVEDDENIRNLLSVALTGFGYQTEAFETAEEALVRMEEKAPDLAVFDWMLPGMDGTDAIKAIRSKRNPKLSQLPILLLTAKDKELDKVEGLDGGADDYMVKPFGILELSARIRSLLRRTRKEEEGENKKQIKVGAIQADKQTREVFSGGSAVDLTKKEYDLLICLMENHSRILTREELLNKIWGYDYEGESRTLDMHIKTLRQKLGDRNGACIKTIRGVGYRMLDTETARQENG
jgi:two-component system alkaline phosphatase synthesis response regulator PhoP